jgi:hypothetical protein
MTTRSLRATGTWFALFLTAALTAGGCVTAGSKSAPSGSSVPGSSSSPVATPAPSDSRPRDCPRISVSSSHAPFTIANLARFDSIVVADVKKIEAARFNTSDGKKPTPSPNGSLAGTVVTPVTVSIVDPVRGDVSLGSSVVLLSGGETECVTVYDSDAPTLTAGMRYVFFLWPSVDAAGQRHPELLGITAAWPIDAKGNVETALEGSIPLSDFKAAVAKVTQ